jgi:gamma-glutamylcysteine synthetase
MQSVQPRTGLRRRANIYNELAQAWNSQSWTVSKEPQRVGEMPFFCPDEPQYTKFINFELDPPTDVDARKFVRFYTQDKK